MKVEMGQFKETAGLISNSNAASGGTTTDNGTFETIITSSSNDRKASQKKNIMKSSLGVAGIFLVLILTMVLFMSNNTGPPTANFQSSHSSSPKNMLKQSAPGQMDNMDTANEEADPTLVTNMPKDLESTIVTTGLGQVKGYSHMSRDGRKYWAFFKVPYAQPPLDRLRFRVLIQFFFPVQKFIM